VWIGLGVSALFLALLLRQVDGGELRDALAEAQPGWLALGFAVYLLALWVRAARWRLVLRPAVRISTADAFALVVIGYAANNVLPLRAGELVRAQLLHERHGASRMAGLGTIVIERILDGLVLAIFLATTVALAGGTGLLRGLALAMLTGFVAALGLVLIAGARPHLAARLAALAGLAPARWRPAARRLLDGFLAGLTTLRGRGRWALVAALTAASWSLEAAMYWLVGLGFGLDLDPLLYFGVCGAANLAIGVPSSSGGVGPFEYFAREVVVAFGATTAAATAYAIALHALLLIPVVLMGLALLWRRHIAVRSVLRPAVDPGARAPEPAAPRVAAK
jgi:uncharacterized protein (TIRG00374 family)